MLIDTLKTRNQLVQSGFSDDQAEALVDTFNAADAQVATKEDIEHLRVVTQQEIEQLRQWSEKEFAQLREWAEQEFKQLREWTEQEFEQSRGRNEQQFAHLRGWAEQEFEQIRAEAKHERQLLEERLTKTILTSVFTACGLVIAAMGIMVSLVVGLYL